MEQEIERERAGSRWMRIMVILPSDRHDGDVANRVKVPRAGSRSCHDAAFS